VTTDLPDVDARKWPLATRRMVIAQVSLCKGCCCGNVERGRPEVPVERMKQEWRARGLSKVVQLTISGCLGPCDVVNVVRISAGDDDAWLGKLRSLDDYLDLVNWAEESKNAGKPAPLSDRMKERRINPFRNVERFLSVTDTNTDAPGLVRDNGTP
jgi:cobaltochelatase CobN